MTNAFTASKDRQRRFYLFWFKKKKSRLYKFQSKDTFIFSPLGKETDLGNRLD